MNSEAYLNKLRAGGDLLAQLQVHADEYTGPCGQSQTVMEATSIKRKTLLDAKAEIERLQGLLGVEPSFKSLHFENGKLDATIGPHWASRLMACSFRESVKEAENFLTMTFRDDEGVLLVTIRRGNGKTPEEKFMDARSILDAIDELRAEECSSVEIVNDNPDFGGPKNLVNVMGEWTKTEYNPVAFTGESLADCLQKAVAAKRKALEPQGEKP